MAHDGHVTGPREPTWTLAWRLRGVYNNGLAVDEPAG